MTDSISPEELLAKVNHKLEGRNLALMKCQNLSRACVALGDYYLMDLSEKSLVDTHVDLEKIARDEGCLAEWEELLLLYLYCWVVRLLVCWMFGTFDVSR